VGPRAVLDAVVKRIIHSPRQESKPRTRDQNSLHLLGFELRYRSTYSLITILTELLGLPAELILIEKLVKKMRSVILIEWYALVVPEFCNLL
jgi:hypothetical protein